MADFNDETNDLIDNAAADLINASAKEQADEIRNEAQNSIDTENSALQQNTAALNANAQAQKTLNDEKQKTLTIQQALDKAVQESLKQRNEMMVYHGTGADFNQFSRAHKGEGVGQQAYGEGIYFTTSKQGATQYAELSKNQDISYAKYKREIELATGTEAVESIINAFKKNLVTAAIPKDDGKNYFDLTAELDEKTVRAVRTRFNFLEKHNEELRLLEQSLKDRKEYPEADFSYDHYHSIKTNDHFRDLINSWNYEGEDVNFDKQILKNRLGYKGISNHGESIDEKYYIVFNPDDTRIIKKEDITGDNKRQTMLDKGIDDSLYNPVTYVDESLKSAIEGSSFDGARFILDIAEAIKQKIIPADGAKLASGSFVIGPDLENFTAQKVNDLILTNDGRAYITDKADNIIATKDLGSLGEGEQKIRLEGSREPIGILSNEDAVTFKTLADAIESLTSKKNILIESASALKGQEYQKNASNIDNLSLQVGKVENTKDKWLQIAADMKII